MPDNLSVEYDGIYHEKSQKKPLGHISMKTMRGRKPNLNGTLSEDRFASIDKFPQNLSTNKRNNSMVDFNKQGVRGMGHMINSQSRLIFYDHEKFN
jgi:hypothetical protein